jgi:hypothetical protein
MRGPEYCAIGTVLRAGDNPTEMDMTEAIQAKLISRRSAFSLMGLALPAAMLAVSQAKAQTAGMERREDRREDRQDRREDRRDDRQDRREDRQDAREDRRDERRGGSDATTGSSAGAAGQK